MAKRKSSEYKYLLNQFGIVDRFLSGKTDDEEKLMSAIVSFCIVFERVYKMMLYDRNCVLVYDMSKTKDDIHLINIINRVVDDNEGTIRFETVIKRYNSLSNDKFTDDENEGLMQIYKLRNYLVHGYKLDEIEESKKKNIKGVMSLLWKKISNQTISLFGEKIIKPAKSKLKFTESQLKEAIKDDVRKLLEQKERTKIPISFADVIDLKMTEDDLFSEQYRISGVVCPRCKLHKFHPKNYYFNEYDSLGLNEFMSSVNAEVYVCDSCHLELTRRQYEYAMEILKEPKSESLK